MVGGNALGYSETQQELEAVTESDEIGEESAEDEKTGAGSDKGNGVAALALV